MKKKDSKGSKSNLLDITQRINKKLERKNAKNPPKTSLFLHNSSKEASSLLEPLSNPLTSISKIRQDILTKERRKVKRSFLREFICLHAVVPERGLLEVFLQDISTEGVAFDVDGKKGQFRKGERVALRIYITADTYFPFTVQIHYIRNFSMNGWQAYRHGASFIKNSLNSKALLYFAKFIESSTAVLRKDTGDVMVSQRV